MKVTRAPPAIRVSVGCATVGGRIDSRTAELRFLTFVAQNEEASMRRLMGFMLAGALVIPGFVGIHAVQAKTKSAASEESTSGSSGMSKDDQEKLREHNKLRAEIQKVKYPAPKSDVVAHVKGIKADDKKWFSETLPDRTYNSADEVFSALGWETTPAEGATKATKPNKASK
jgi:hypothetical protein